MDQDSRDGRFCLWILLVLRVQESQDILADREVLSGQENREYLELQRVRLCQLDLSRQYRLIQKELFR